MDQTENRQQYLRAEGFFAVARQKQTYLNLLYLLAAFPLGILYFVVLITGLSFGIGTLIIWIGVPAPYIKDPRLATLPWTRQLLARLRAPVTWTSLVYLLLVLPFGIFSFTVVIALLATSISLVLGWLVYLIATAVYQNSGGVYNSTVFFTPINGQIQPGALGFFLLLFVLG